MNLDITVIGGGLAGCEAAWQIARQGLDVRLYEMRPLNTTPAHTTDLLGELVCSNSLKSELEGTAPYLLKQELRQLGSLLMQIADEVKVPAGHALAVDRARFGRRITEEILNNPRICVLREEVRRIPDEGIVIIASGPLTSPSLSESLVEFTGTQNLYFYDAISPIVDAATLDISKLFHASRYGKGGGDYLNAPLSRKEYLQFYDALVSAESVPLKDFENPVYFESCLPIEELARRGEDTLRFGPMKPVGLIDPATDRRPYAAVQLRMENLMADCYNLVGFQNHMKYSEQSRVFRLIPGLEKAEFVRFGQIHRNSYIHSPRLLHATLQARTRPRLFFSGQLCGVEGYVESIATGLLAGINAARLARGRQTVSPPESTACGSLLNYISSDAMGSFQPVNITFGLLGTDGELNTGVRDKKERRRLKVRKSLETMTAWVDSLDLD